MINAILVTSAGVVLIAASLARYALAWRAANAAASRAVTYARTAISTTSEPIPTLDLRAALNEPYVVIHDRDVDWMAPAATAHARVLEPDYEGLHRDDPASADAWIAELERAGHSVTRAQTSLDRAHQRVTNEDFDRFDRIMTGMVERMWTTNRATITRWDADWRDWQASHEQEATALALDETREWIKHEKGTVTREFERIVLAEALLVS